MNIKFLALVIFSLCASNSFAGYKKTTQSITKGVNTDVLIKHTLSAGGGQMFGNNYEVISSIGQLDAGHNTTGGGKQFIGGILATPRNNTLFKDGFE